MLPNEEYEGKQWSWKLEAGTIRTRNNLRETLEEKKEKKTARILIHRLLPRGRTRGELMTHTKSRLLHESHRRGSCGTVSRRMAKYVAYLFLLLEKVCSSTLRLTSGLFGESRCGFTKWAHSSELRYDPYLVFIYLDFLSCAAHFL